MNIRAFIEEVHSSREQKDYIFLGAIEAVKSYGRELGLGKGREFSNKVQFTSKNGTRINFFKVTNKKDFWKFLGTYDNVFAIDADGIVVGDCKDSEILLALKSQI